MIVELAICVETRGRSARELRESFAEAVRQALSAEYKAGRIDLGSMEELRRALPRKGRA